MCSVWYLDPVTGGDDGRPVLLRDLAAAQQHALANELWHVGAVDARGGLHGKWAGACKDSRIGGLDGGCGEENLD